MLQLKKKASLKKLTQIYAESHFLLCCHCNNINTSDWLSLKKELSKQQLLNKVKVLLVKNQIAKNFFINDSKINSLGLAAKAQGSTSFNQSFFSESTVYPKCDKTERLVLDSLSCETSKVVEGSSQSLAAPTHQVSTSSESENLANIYQNHTRFIPRPEQLFNYELLFQGPTLILGCTESEIVIPLLNLTSNYNKLLVIGGVLEKKIINHLDINFLKKLDNSIFLEMINVLEHAFINLLLCSQKSPQTVLLLLEKIKRCS